MTMKTLLVAILLGSGLLVNAVSTPGNCTNYACNYCEDLAASCQDAPTASQNGTDCLCTERFRVNLNRCVQGVVCAWDGNGSPDPPRCVADCVGTFDAAFLSQCPGSITASGASPTATGGSTGLNSATPTNTETTTRTGIANSPNTSTTPGANGASAAGVSMGVVVGLAGLLTTWGTVIL
ncbi:hypothetical protein M408DRAFT_325451, partial [Serendipita vermifera MAFF 305830]